MSAAPAPSSSEEPDDDGAVVEQASVYDPRLGRRILGFVRPYPKLAVGALLLLPVAMVFDLVQPKILQLAIDNAVTANNPGSLGMYAVAFLVSIICQQVASYFQMLMLELLGERATCDLRVRLYKHMLSLRLAFFERSPVGKLLTRISSDIDAITEAFSAGLVTLVADFVRIAVIIVILLRMDAKLTAVALVSAPVLFGVARMARRVMRSAYETLRRCLSNLNAFAQEHLQGMSLVQSFCKEVAVEAGFEKRNDAYRKANHRSIGADAVLYAVVEMVGTIALATMLYGGGRRMAEGTLTIGVLVAFIQYLERLYMPIRDLSSKYTVMQSAMVAARRIFEILDTVEPDAPRLEAARAEKSAPPAPADDSADVSADRPLVALEQVSFAYVPGVPVLRELTLAVYPGETVAIVGLSGAGKSTVVKMLLRLVEPQSGVVRFCGQDVRTMDPAELRRKIVLVLQEPFLFSGTLEDNIRLGRQDITNEAIALAAERVGVTDLVERREARWRAPVVERGLNFSAGERQLLAFTRALAVDPELLILDEATANVDSESEQRIEAGTEALMAGRTSIVIAHRLSTLGRASRIIVLGHGRILEQGTHAELIALRGHYHRLYELQANAA